jgi:hypothetical protein
MEKVAENEKQPEITLDLLALKVKEMRDTQKEYFRARKMYNANDLLQKSKSLEKELDRMVETVLNKQTTLF